MASSNPSRRSGLWRRLILLGVLALTFGSIPAPAATAQSVPPCTIVGTPGNDALIGTAGDDVICGLGGDDTLEGLGGNDLLIGGPGDDVLAGNSGDDELFGHAGEDRLFGGPGNDLVAGGGDADLVRGGDGDDELHGEDGGDRLIGDAGDDSLWGGAGDDSLEGRADNDTLRGGPGSDQLSGNGGNDTLFGQAGDDTLIGGPGLDQLSGGGDADVLRGGADDDVILGEDGPDHLLGDGGNDHLIGGADNDLIEGGTGDDTLRGNDGDDVLAGNGGADTLFGDAGADTLFGGPGTDSCDGGIGTNTFSGCEVVPWIQVGSDIDGEAPFDQSGYSVAMNRDGRTVAVGAPYNDANGETSGQVRVYRFDGAGWIQLGGDIDGDSGGAGLSVATSSDGNTVVVGSRLHCCIGDGTNVGQVRVYRFDGFGWIQVGGDIMGEAADLSTQSVASSDDGNTIIIGADYNGGTGPLAGHARVYRFDGSSWTQVGSDIDGEAAGDRFGGSVDISGDGSRVIIGAQMNEGNGPVSGHARVFHFDGTAWIQLGSDIDGDRLQGLGRSVAMNAAGDVVVIGAALATHVFRFDGAAWVQVGSEIGVRAVAVAMNGTGDTVIIGGSESGAAGSSWVFHFDGTVWLQVGATIEGETIGDMSGFAVAMSSTGDTVVIGAPLNDGNGTFAGHARVFSAP